MDAVTAVNSSICWKMEHFPLRAPQLVTSWGLLALRFSSCGRVGFGWHIVHIVVHNVHNARQQLFVCYNDTAAGMPTLVSLMLAIK